MRVALIGGRGFIGSELSKYLLGRGHRVDVYSRSAHLDEGSDRLAYFTMDPSCDASDTLSLADSMVVLAAQRPYADFAFRDYEVNVRIGEHCFALAAANGVKNIVYVSTKAVYSDQRTMPWTEETCPSPASLYGASKAAVEQLAAYYNTRYGMAIKCLRLAQVIGMGEREGHLIGTLIRNALEKKRQVVFGDGSQRRQYVYVKDACEAILAALEKPTLGGVFNVGMPGSISNLELTERVNEVFGNQGNLVCDATRPMGSVCDEMDVEKARDTLGFYADRSLQEILVDMRDSDTGERMTRH